jgi:hypothetical protein
MSWIWGEKKSKGKVRLGFTAENNRGDLITRTVKVHLELDMEYPQNIDIVQAIVDTETSFNLPAGIELKGANIAHIEILGEPDAK